MANTLEEAFHQKLVEVYQRAKTECHYNAVRFHQMVQQDGGIATAKKLLASTQYPEGLTQLWELKRLDLSMEAIVLQEAWRALFTADELAVAKKRLADLGCPIAT